MNRPVGTRSATTPVYEPGRIARMAYRVFWWAGRLVTGGYWRLEVHGAERLPSAGPYVIAPIHRSNLDFFLAGMITKRPVRWMAKSTIFKGGAVDRFLVGMGRFPVHRERIDRDAIRQAEAHLGAGRPVVIFPEGRRQEGPTVERMFDGPAFVACRQRVPIVPLGIGGSDRAMPIGSKMILPRKVVLVIGEPIYPDIPVSGRVHRSTVAALSAELQTAIQVVYDESKRLARVDQP